MGTVAEVKLQQYGDGGGWSTELILISYLYSFSFNYQVGLVVRRVHTFHKCNDCIEYM